MLGRRHGVSTLAALAWALSAAAQRVRYDIICDAGSTGTRMYLFTSTFSVDANGKETLKVATDVIGKKKPGLSSYAASPADAVGPILQLFAKVQEKIPQDQWAETTVSVFATAGVRALEPHLRQPIFDAVRQGLVSSEQYVFSKDSLLTLRMLTGTEEGTFSLLCVNFLTGRIDHHLSVTEHGSASKLLGILDLGGSSTQIAVPPVSTDDLTDFRGSTVVRSYAAYGMEQMRGRLDKHAVEQGMTSSPCYFRGYQESTHNLLGSGEAHKCRQMLLEVFANSRQQCKAGDHECMPGADEAVAQVGSKGMQFFAVSGYLFVTDFASHWLLRSGTQGSGIAPKLEAAGNRLTIDELEAAADELCTSEWTPIEQATAGGKDAGAHRYTDATKAPHRCLEANYVATLLRHAYGFPSDQRFVTFEDEVEGNDVEWPLGALLHMRHEASQGGRKEL